MDADIAERFAFAKDLATEAGQFLSGLTSWCISIAYLRGDAVQFGGVCNPLAGEMFTGGLAAPAVYPALVEVLG